MTTATHPSRRHEPGSADPATAPPRGVCRDPESASGCGIRKGYAGPSGSPGRRPERPGVLAHTWISWWCLGLLMALAVSGADGQYYYDEEDYLGECSRYIYQVEIEPPTERLLEIHVRHNIPGFIAIEDGDYENGKIRIQVDKTASVEKQLSGIIVNQTVFDMGKSGKVFILQLDHNRVRSRTVPIVIGSAVAGLILLVLLLVMIWWYYRRRQVLFDGVPVVGTSQGCTDGRESTCDGDDMEESVVLTTPVHRVDQNGGTQGTQSCPPPPPPCRGDPTYMSAVEARQLSMSGSPRPTGSPGGMSRGTMVTLSIVTVVSVVYASCPYDAQARVRIIIPPAYKLDSIALFFNREFQNELYTHNWLHQNGTQVRVFDLDSAAPTEHRPCTGGCHNAYVQNLAGCDAATGQCVCQRGYSLRSGVCVDFDECKHLPNACPVPAHCINTVGSYICKCGYGVYGRKTCKPCSVGCPSGSFESSPCTNFGDRVCTECKQCEGSMYEARPCGGTQDRQCMHVAHPLLIAGEETTPVFLEELKVETSDNVFAEDLHNTRNLKTTYYVTDMTQAYDFSWDRDSGLQVNIGILDIHLIPEYEDVDEASDNSYVLDNPNDSEDKVKFKDIVTNHCRHPIPDYYSITLEISRDRTTSANEITCNTRNEVNCPDGYNSGDIYLKRTLNDACPKMGTFPEALKTDSNSIVCTENTALLREVFNQTYTTERPIRFPPKRCRTAQSRCEQCLNQPRCRLLELFEQKCCHIECYILPDCKLAQSEECLQAEVECAMGDAYRYTLQPVFQNVKEQYMCHVRHRVPRVLYQLFFYVQIPNRGFQTPKMYKTVYARDQAYQSQGEYFADFFTVEHNTALDLQDEFIMLGMSDGKRVDYSLHSLKAEEEYKRKKRVTMHEISHNIYVASTQFERPFDYSTSVWGHSDNNCHKNVSKFLSVQRPYSTSGTGQGVNVLTKKEREGFKYFLKSSENAPYIRFTVPGNMSILPFYFRDKGPTLVTDDTLKAELELTSGGKIWSITIAGQMDGCPGYLGITINNRLDLEEVFRYDLLVLCPSEFNVTFKVPNWGQEPDKTFDVQLQDSKRSYDIYLTEMIFEQQRIETAQEQVTVAKSRTLSLFIPALVVGVTVICLVFLFLGYVYIEKTKAKTAAAAYNDSSSSSSRHKVQDVYLEPPGGGHDPLPIRSPSSGCAGFGSRLTQRQTAFIGFYIVLRIIYSLLFTFTVFFALLVLFIGSDLEQLRSAGVYQSKKYNDTVALAAAIDRYSQDELIRQGSLVTSMQGACSHYIGELFETMTKEMDNITASQHLLDMYSKSSSISFLMHQHSDDAMGRYGDKLSQFTTNYRSYVNASIQSSVALYRKYLRHNVFHNDWFQFPQMLFNETKVPRGRDKGKDAGVGSMLDGPAVDFGLFLDIEEVEAVMLWDVQYWEKYINGMPGLPALPVPDINHQTPQCQRDAMTTSGLSNHTALNHLDSTQFIATHLHDFLPAFGPKYTATHLAEEYKFIAASKEDARRGVDFSVPDFIANLNIDVLRILFLALDAILLIYRFSHTYMSATVLCHGFEESVPREENRVQTLGPGAGAGGGRDLQAAEPIYRTADRPPPTPTPTPACMDSGHHQPDIPYPAVPPPVTRVPPPPRQQQQQQQQQPARDPHHPPTEEGPYSDPSPIPDYTAPLNGKHRHQGQYASSDHYQDPSAIYARGNHGNKGGGVDAVMGYVGGENGGGGRDSKFDLFKRSVARLVLSPTLPKVLVACAILLFFYISIRAVTLILDIQVISELDGFSVFLGALNIQLNQTNWYLTDQATHFNKVTMKIYEGQMKSELLNLQSMLEYFNTEQRRLVDNYVSEACSILHQAQSNWTCDVTIQAPTLAIPMLPCNFIPIQPQLYTGFDSLQYQSQLGSSFEPYVISARNVILTTGYAILVAVATMLLIHITGGVIFHYLKTRRKFPVRRIYVTASASVMGGVRQTRAEDSDEESEETEHGHYSQQSFNTPTRVRMSPQKSNPLLTDFKYSETKV